MSSFLSHWHCDGDHEYVHGGENGHVRDRAIGDLTRIEISDYQWALSPPNVEPNVVAFDCMARHR